MSEIGYMYGEDVHDLLHGGSMISRAFGHSARPYDAAMGRRRLERNNQTTY